MRAIIVLCLLTVNQLVLVMCIDPAVHVSFARVSPKEISNHRLRRDVLSPSAYTEEEKKDMLDAHNEYRRTTDPSAADMNLLTWNVQLADSAQSWAEQCIWDHGQVEFEDQQYDPMGQNLWRGGGKVSVSAVNAWMNEDKYYNYTNNSCQDGKACGHYTQVLWGDTKEVGCGFHSCDDGKTIVACNYGPAGNYNRHPYLDGPRCSLCPAPGFCYNGLCSTQCYDPSVINETCECAFECQHCGIFNKTECTCECRPGWHGPQCQEPCEDTSDYCYNGWYKAQCSGYLYVRDGCPAMCSECEKLTDTNAYDCPCDGKICKNGGQLDTGSCICICTEEYSGDVCEHLVTTTTIPTETGIETEIITEQPNMTTETIPIDNGSETQITTEQPNMTTEQPNTITAQPNMTTQPNMATASSMICHLTCSNGLVLDLDACECKQYDGEPPVGSANISKSSPVSVIILTTIILFSHFLSTCHE